MPSTDKQRSILALPLVSSLPHHLEPDAATPSVSALFSLSKPVPVTGQRKPSEMPSMLRRSRGVSKGAGFAFVTPLLKEFPYDIKKPKRGPLKKVDGDEAVTAAQGVEANGKPEEPEAVVDDEDENVTMADVEAYLGSLEPSFDHPVPPAVSGGSSAVRGFTSPTRTAHYETTRSRILAVSREAAAGCVPDLLLGDEGDPAWEELKRVASGELVIARPPGVRALDGDEKISELGFAPWSLAYAGHQFGSFAGQLGDGRAVSIASTPVPREALATGFNLPPALLPSSAPRAVTELQIKGSGRTPFSRFADGLAVLRSSIREFLGAEAVHALGIPTSRVLALVDAKGVKVAREKVEGAATVVRMNPGSWIRIGSFELPAWREDWEGLRRLVRYSAKHVLGIGASPHANGVANGSANEEPPESKSLAAALLTEVAHANAIMVARWQAYGFTHNVINSDNVSVSGTTIDYGPYAFLDVFDENAVFNHSDDMGRYSYKNQPPMVLFGVRKLGEVLSEMIGAELEMHAQQGAEGRRAEVGEGWAGSVSKDKMSAWQDEGAEVVNEVQKRFQTWFIDEYTAQMRKRLGLSEAGQDDFSLIVTPLLSMLGDHALDYSLTLRRLAFAPPASSPDLAGFLTRLVPLDAVSAHQRDDAHQRWRDWLAKLDDRFGSADRESTKRQRLAANPRFVLRQWVLEETIQKAEQDGEEGRRHLEKVLEMSRHPFEPYGEGREGSGDEACPVGEAAEEQRLCGVGPKSMLGFQCSCSS